MQINLGCNFKKYCTFFLIIFAINLLNFSTTKPAAAQIKNFNLNLKNYNNKLQIFDKNKLKATFKVAIADNNQKRSIGLMNVKNMAQDHGMIFIFDENKEIAMWMKNTHIPLDMIFIDKNNQIVSIKHMATPFSLEIIPSKFKVTKTLEINGGLAQKLNIKIGQKIKLLRNENF